MSTNAFRKKFVAMLSVLALSACQHMGPTENGLVFRKLPPTLGGGVSKQVISSGRRVLVMPWDSVYRFDSSVQDISWGDKSPEGPGPNDDYVHTRALDGNEVALGVTIRYQVKSDPTTLVKMVQEVATSNEEVRSIVSAVARGEIRNEMNKLKTSEFLDEKSRYDAIDRVRAAMDERLRPFGIEIQRVNLDDFRFERLLREGSIDSSYQEKLTEIQKMQQDTERERSRIETVKAKKQQEYNTVMASVNRVIAEANGYKNQTTLRGDGYFQARANEAQSILAQGKAEVQGLIEQINALVGPGGQAILKLELARHLSKSDPKYVLMAEPSSKSGIEVRRMDANELMQQMGILEGLQKPQVVEKKLEPAQTIQKR